MSKPGDFDFPMSQTFRKALPLECDYRTSSTFAFPDRSTRRTSTPPGFQDQQIDDLKHQLRFWKKRALEAEQELRSFQARQATRPIAFDGPETAAG